MNITICILFPQIYYIYLGSFQKTIVQKFQILCVLIPSSICFSFCFKRLLLSHTLFRNMKLQDINQLRMIILKICVHFISYTFMAIGESCRCLAFHYRTTHIWISVIITTTLKAVFFPKCTKQQYFLLNRNYYKCWMKDTIRTEISQTAVAPQKTSTTCQP